MIALVRDTLAFMIGWLAAELINRRRVQTRSTLSAD